MDGFLAIFNMNLLNAMLRLATPITLAAIGATICERSGIVNIAMEGIMLVGAFFALTGAYYSGSPWIGMIMGILAGGVFSLIHAAATITLHLDHVVSGAVLNILALGITKFLMVLIFGHPGTTDSLQTSLNDFAFRIPLLSKIPIIGELLFSQTPIVFMSFILVIVFAYIMKKTKLGLHIKAAGEHPLALETIGVSVVKIRYIGVLISGLTSGLAGAFLSIENASSFTEGMTAGRGFLALAANISGGWTPTGSFIASLFFGFSDALQIRFQVMKVLNVPSELFIIFPYAVAVIAVAGFVRRSRAPKALGSDFIIEQEK
jgi:general nucleoside transport system permease protein